MIMATKLPPGPPGRFLTGNLREFRRDMLAFYLDSARQYGDVVRVRLGPRSLYLVSHPDLIEEVLQRRNSNFRKHYALKMNRLLLGNGLLSSDGDFWVRQRRLIQPAFLRERIFTYAATMTTYARQLVDRWQDGQTRDVYADMRQLTLAIAARTFFGADVEGQGPVVFKALRAVMDSFNDRLFSVLRLPESVPTPKNIRAWRAIRRLDELLYGLINARREDGA